MECGKVRRMTLPLRTKSARKISRNCAYEYEMAAVVFSVLAVDMFA